MMHDAVAVTSLL